MTYTLAIALRNSNLLMQIIFLKKAPLEGKKSPHPAMLSTPYLLHLKIKK